MVRSVLAVVFGLFTWTVVATIVNLVVRVSWPDYAAVEVAMLFTLPMLVVRLLVGALASIGAGLVTARIDHRSAVATRVLAIVLFLFFVPVHVGLWDRFPIWYHGVFLASLIVLPIASRGLLRGPVEA